MLRVHVTRVRSRRSSLRSVVVEDFDPFEASALASAGAGRREASSWYVLVTPFCSCTATMSVEKYLVVSEWPPA